MARLWHVALLPLVLSAPTATRAAPEDLVGIWKLCYEPGLAGVDEPTERYLVLLPDNRCFEMRVDCCPDPGEPAGSTFSEA